MLSLLRYIRQYIRELNPVVFSLCVAWIALLVFLNYRFDLESRIYLLENLPFRGFIAPAIVYSLAFFPALLIHYFFNKKKYDLKGWVVVLLIISPLIFAIKVGLPTWLDVFPTREWELYWNKILYWPLRVFALLVLLWAISRAMGRPREVMGLKAPSFHLKPYFIMLAIMLPLIAAASTQPDFLHTYPKLKQVLPLPEGADPSWFYKLLYELGYSTDFISIEVFFRGFLVIGFSRWLGKDAILPMACFYCSIHFGKPLGECISSFFGGLLLGVVSYHSRQIYGGLIVHLGIAWLMELGGYIGNSLKG